MKNTRVKQDLPIKKYILFLKNHFELVAAIVLIFSCLSMLYLEKKHNQTLANIKITARDYIMSSSNLPLLCIRNSFTDSVKKCKYIVNEKLDDKLQIRPLAEPVYDEKFLGKVQTSTTEYSDVFEERRQALTTKLPSEIELCKRSIDENTLTTQVLYSENLRLKNLLNFILLRDDWEYVTTRVTAVNERGSSFISIGTEHGIQNNQLAVNDNGLVGKVIDVGKSSARLLLFNDKNFRIPVMMVESGIKAIAVGSNLDYLQLLYLPNQTKIKEGETVVTIGDNDFILSGIYVGQVTKNNRVKTNVNLRQIDFLSIITPKLASN